MKKKVIFLPNEEQTSQMMENAWQDFLKLAEEDNWEISELMKENFILKDMFMAGYCYGYNECLSIIRGQMECDGKFYGLHEQMES